MIKISSISPITIKESEQVIDCMVSAARLEFPQNRHFLECAKQDLFGMFWINDELPSAKNEQRIQMIKIFTDFDVMIHTQKLINTHTEGNPQVSRALRDIASAFFYELQRVGRAILNNLQTSDTEVKEMSTKEDRKKQFLPLKNFLILD